MATTGKLLSSDTYPAGSSIAEAPAGDRLPVYEPYDFSPDGGQVSIDGEVYDYTSVDFETSELIGALAWPALASGLRVLVEPYAETKLALVQLTGDEGDGLQALVPHSLSALLEDGQRDPDNAETVTLEQSRPGVWQVLDVLDRPALLTPEAGAELPPPDPTDGAAPDESPAVAAIGGIGTILLRWTAIENADPVTYQVHVATYPDFVPDETTLVATTPASSVSVKTLPDGSPLAYDTAYYFRIVATDADGAAPAGEVAGAMLFKVTGPDIAADYVYAGNIIANQILGGTINADLLLSGSIRTGEAGARVELGPFGIVVYDSAGVPTTLLGSDGLSTFKGQVQASTLSVTAGMTIQGTANEVAQAGSITLAAGVSASPNAPTVVTDYETMPSWKQSGGAAWPAGYEYKTLQRVGTDWLVGMRQVSTDEFVARQFNDDGSFDSYHGDGWIGQQTKRVAYVNSGLPVYAFRATDRRIVADEHSTNGGAAINSIDWHFGAGQPAGTTEDGTVSYPSGRCRLSVPSTAGPASYLHSSSTMDMRGRRVSARVEAVGTFTQPGQRIELRMRNATAGEYILARIEGDTGVIKLQTYAGPGTTKIATSPYFAVNHRYWRMTESNGDARLQTSADGNTWGTTLTITDHGLTDADLASMTLSLIVDDEDEGTATVGEFDNVTVGAGFLDYGDVIPWADVANYPGLGSDGTNILAAEINGSGVVKIYEIDPRSPGRIVTTYTSGTHVDFTDAEPLITVQKGSFDFGATRFVLTEGSSGNQASFVFSVSGTTLTYQRNESFYVPGQAGSGWDGTAFQTMATDGVRRKHTTILWTSTSAWERTFYAATTWYDGDATGGTHETTPSPRAAFSLRKRARYTVTSAAIPDLGGTNDPDRIRIYLSDSAIATLYRQTTTAAGVNSAVLTATTLSGTAAPISNDFPDAIAARIVNDAGTLDIAGDGTIEGTVIVASTALTSPLATFDQLIVTDRTFARVKLAANWPTPGATLADVTGLSQAVDVDGAGDVYQVTLVADAGTTSGTGIMVAVLVVDGAVQDTEAHFASAVTGYRSTVAQHYLITGLPAGSRIFKVQARSTSGVHQLSAPHTTMTIAQVA